MLEDGDSITPRVLYSSVSVADVDVGNGELASRGWDDDFGSGELGTRRGVGRGDGDGGNDGRVSSGCKGEELDGECG